MTRHVILGNGKILVCMDKHARIRDFYYPHVGQENHVSGNHNLTGVWVDGRFSWISKDEWDLSIKYKKDTLVSDITAKNNKLDIELKINEAVHHEKNFFLRKIEIKNNLPIKREVRIFFSSNYIISEANVGDTVYYNPNLDSIVHYKGRRYFLMGGLNNGKPFDDYATGIAGVDGKEGSYIDAEDGVLSKNNIEHGSVDSVLGFTVKLKPDESKIIYYWIVVGQRHREIEQLKNFIIEEGPENLMQEIERHWIHWLDNKKINFINLNEEVQDLFKRSLLIVRAQTDNEGAIIAANDTHTFHRKKDTYSYMWPRDGALIARSLDKVGHIDITRKFFNFCSRIITQEGYFLHKYRPDGSLGSSWHPWLKNNNLQLPIQEDQTALIIYALWRHYRKHKNDEMVKNMYKHFIKRAADFMVKFRDKKTGLPAESYDLWEEKLGIHTFTCCTVCAGLEAASKLAEIFGTKKDADKYQKASNEIKELIIKYLYDEETGIFIKRIYYDSKGNSKKDKTIDASTFYGLFEYVILHIDDPKMEKTFEQTLEKLWCKAPCGGLCRYEDDNYYRVPNHPENPWIISTMWLAEYYITKAKTIDNLKEAEQLFKWAVDRALPSGVLSEQLNPHTGETLSVAPLTWSHAGFIISVIKYLDKFNEIKGKEYKN